MLISAARRTLKGDVLAAGLFLLTATPGALGDLLPNELPGDSPLTVTVRGEAGRYYRPGLPIVLKITIQNSGEPCRAIVRVSETREGGTAQFGGTGVLTLASGSNDLDILAAPAGPTAGAKLHIGLLVDRGSLEEQALYRGDLTRVLRPLGSQERLLLAAGVEAFPLPDGFVHVLLDPRELPSEQYAYSAVSVMVLERVRREDIRAPAARALVNWVRSGGHVVFASFRALAPFERALFGGETPPRTLADLRETVPDSKEHRLRGLPPGVSFPFGLGRVSAFAAEPGDGSNWTGEAALAEFLEARPARRHDCWIDSGVFRSLAPERPFGSAADRAKSVAVVGALAAGVAVALSCSKKRPLAAAALGGTSLVWAAAAALAFGAPEGAIRVVRVRAFPADGRAEITTDTVVFSAFRRDGVLGIRTALGPVLPVGHRHGERLSVPFRLGRAGEAWRLRRLPTGGEGLAAARSCVARGVDEKAERLRVQALARGSRGRIESLPGGRRRLEFEGEGPASDVRYLLETFAPPGEELAWLWIEGEPDGVHAMSEGRIDPAPGSGTLVIAAAPPSK